MQRISQFWEHLPLRTKGIVLAIIPVLAILVSASFAYAGNRQRERAETDVTRHFEVVTQLEELLTLLVNAETGTRGYLLTRRTEFLQPYRLASQQLPPKIAALRAVVQQEPGDKPRAEKTQLVNRIDALRQQQMRALTNLQNAPRNAPLSSGDLYAQLANSKRMMDDFRAQLRLMRGEEKRLLAERLSEIAYVRHRDYLAIILTLLVSLAGRFLAVYLFNTGVVERVERIKSNVRCLGNNAELPFPPTTKPDALSQLEQEVAQTHERLKSP